MSKSICVILGNFATESVFPTNSREGKPNKIREVALELKLSFDGEQYYLEEAWLDETIDFYAIADKYNFLDKLLEEALVQKLLDEKNAKAEHGYTESFD